jgi:hypothetical protein
LSLGQGAGGRDDNRSLGLATKKGRRISNCVGAGRTCESMRAAVRLWTERFPGVVPRSASAGYNCAGMVFGARRTCIDADLVRWILHEDGYRMLPTADAAGQGDLVVYTQAAGTVTHVGVIVEVRASSLASSVQIRVLSQWGRDGEYLHLLDDVPACYGRGREFWTDRRGVEWIRSLRSG